MLLPLISVATGCLLIPDAGLVQFVEQQGDYLVDRRQSGQIIGDDDHVTNTANGQPQRRRQQHDHDRQLLRDQGEGHYMRT